MFTYVLLPHVSQYVSFGFGFPSLCPWVGVRVHSYEHRYLQLYSRKTVAGHVSIFCSDSFIINPCKPLCRRRLSRPKLLIFKCSGPNAVGVNVCARRSNSQRNDTTMLIATNVLYSFAVSMKTITGLSRIIFLQLSPPASSMACRLFSFCENID